MKKSTFLLLMTLCFSCEKKNACKKQVRDVFHEKSILTLWIPRNIHNYSIGDTVYLEEKRAIFSKRVKYSFTIKSKSEITGTIECQ
jgi:hypothetical protein